MKFLNLSTLFFYGGLLFNPAAFSQGNGCAAPLTGEDPVFATHIPTKMVPITRCGQNVHKEAAFLAKDLKCTGEQLNAQGAALSLESAFLDLNGKTITLEGEIPNAKGLFITSDSVVADTQQNAKISGFSTGIEVQGNNNLIQNATIEHARIGMQVVGAYNRISRITVQKIGAVIQSTPDSMHIEGKGFAIQGDYNQIFENKSLDIGFDGGDKRVGTMFIQSLGIRIEGNHNLVHQHTVKKLFGNAHGLSGARTLIEGISIYGTSNTVEYSKINGIYASSLRYSISGPQVASIAYGVTLSAPEEEFGNNKVYCSNIHDITAHSKSIYFHSPSLDVLAEAAGIFMIYDNHHVLNNWVKKVDATSDYLVTVVGVRATDNQHVITDNLVEDVGQRSIETDSLKIRGILIDGTQMRVERNQVHENAGLGIQATVSSLNNRIWRNNSQDNLLYDYIETQREGEQGCRNEWTQNRLEQDKFLPEVCFEG